MREKAWPARSKVELWKGQLKKTLPPEITESVLSAPLLYWKPAHTVVAKTY